MIKNSILDKCAGFPHFGQPYKHFKIYSLNLCIDSNPFYLDESNLFSFGPFVVVPLPFIPAPVGIYKYFFPPKNKNFSEEIRIKFIPGEVEISFDPKRVTLTKGDKTNLNPIHFECAWAKYFEESGMGPEFLYNSGTVPIRKPYTLCRLKFDSYEWDFDLLINGIEIEGKSVSLPLIHFKRESRWDKGAL